MRRGELEHLIRLRLIPVFSPATRGATGWCLETHDLVLAKLVAGREKDLHFAKVAAAANLVRVPELLERLEQMSLDPRIREVVAGRVRALR